MKDNIYSTRILNTYNMPELEREAEQRTREATEAYQNGNEEEADRLDHEAAELWRAIKVIDDMAYEEQLETNRLNRES